MCFKKSKILWVLLGIIGSVRPVQANLSHEDEEKIKNIIREMAPEIARGIVLEAGARVSIEVPIGTILPYGGTGSAPDGYVECDGQQLPKSPAGPTGSDYSALYDIIKYTYTPESERNGALFRVPDLRGRVPVGAGKGEVRLAGHPTKELTQRDVGQALGEETHTLTEKEMPKHKHELTNAIHTHPIQDNGHSHSGAHGSSFLSWAHSGAEGLRKVNGDQYVRGFQVNGLDVPMMGQTAPSGSNLTVQPNEVPMGMTESGNGKAHNNMQPSLVVRYIIKWRGSNHAFNSAHETGSHHNSNENTHDAASNLSVDNQNNDATHSVTPEAHSEQHH